MSCENAKKGTADLESRDLRDLSHDELLEVAANLKEENRRLREENRELADELRSRNPYLSNAADPFLPKPEESSFFTEAEKARDLEVKPETRVPLLRNIQEMIPDIFESSYGDAVPHTESSEPWQVDDTGIFDEDFDADEIDEVLFEDEDIRPDDLAEDEQDNLLELDVEPIALSSEEEASSEATSSEAKLDTVEEQTSSIPDLPSYSEEVEPRSNDERSEEPEASRPTDASETPEMDGSPEPVDSSDSPNFENSNRRPTADELREKLNVPHIPTAEELEEKLIDPDELRARVLQRLAARNESVGE